MLALKYVLSVTYLLTIVGQEMVAVRDRRSRYEDKNANLLDVSLSDLQYVGRLDKLILENVGPASKLEDYLYVFRMISYAMESIPIDPFFKDTKNRLNNLRRHGPKFIIKLIEDLISLSNDCSLETLNKIRRELQTCRETVTGKSYQKWTGLKGYLVMLEMRCISPIDHWNNKYRPSELKYFKLVLRLGFALMGQKHVGKYIGDKDDTELLRTAQETDLQESFESLIALMGRVLPWSVQQMSILSVPINGLCYEDFQRLYRAMPGNKYAERRIFRDKRVMHSSMFELSKSGDTQYVSNVDKLLCENGIVAKRVSHYLNIFASIRGKIIFNDLPLINDPKDRLTRIKNYAPAMTLQFLERLTELSNDCEAETIDKIKAASIMCYKTTSDATKAKAVSKWRGLKSYFDALEYRCATLTSFWTRINPEEYHDLLYAMKQVGVILYMDPESLHEYDVGFDSAQLDLLTKYFNRLASLKDLQTAFERMQDFEEMMHRFSGPKDWALTFPEFLKSCSKYSSVCGIAMDDNRDYFDTLEPDEFNVVITQMPSIRDYYELYRICTIIGDLE